MHQDSILRLPIVKLVYDRYGYASPTRDAVIEVRISYNKKAKWLSTGVRVFPKEWQKSSQMVVNRSDAIQLNEFLDKLVLDVKKVVNQMVEEGNVDIFAVPDRLTKLRIKEVDMFQFFRQRLAVRQYGKSEDNKWRYDRFLNFLEEWGVIRNFADISEANIIKLDKLLVEKELKGNTRWNNYHRFLNSFIIDAIDAGYLRKNPYKWLHIEKGNDRVGLGKHLTPDELEKIQNAELETDSLRKVRDIFIFQTYTCLSFHDLQEFDIKKVAEVKGKKVYTGERGKTGIPFTIPLLPPALAVLQKYKGKLPLISNVKYNLYLKEVAKAAGIDKPVTTHWARHTGATLLLNQGVPMEIVSKVCGHSSIKMTEKIYAKLLDETVVKAVNKAEKKRKSNKNRK